MAYTTINKSTDYFNTKLYTGNNSSNHSITVGLEPSFTWIKSVDGTYGHDLYDAVRGATKTLNTNNTNSEYTSADRLTSFDSNGFTLGSGAPVNSGGSFVSWNWKANGAGSANTDGSISSTVSANATSGFSIVKYTGNGTGNSTIGHGLGATPKFIIVKCISATQSWGIKSDSFVSASEPRVLYLNQTGSYANDTNVWGTSAVFNNSTFTVGDWTGSNASGQTFIAYCFAEKQGYSKFGSYTGNGNADGTFVYTGFKPAFILWKNSSASGNNWSIFDNKRDTYNVTNHYLLPNLGNAEGTSDSCDLLSNGFKWRSTDGGSNASGATFIYMAFAAAPLVGTNNVPANAR